MICHIYKKRMVEKHPDIIITLLKLNWGLIE